MPTADSVTTRAATHLTSEAGFALLHCQLFETSMRLLLSYLEESGAVKLGSGDGDELMERIGKWTAGRLAALLSQHAGIDDPDGAVARAVTARNWIVHRYFFDQFPWPSIDAASFEAALARLDSRLREIAEADRLISPRLEELCATVEGVEYAAMKQAVRDALANWPHA